MFSHITVGSRDLERSRDFYDPVLSVLGIHRRSYDPVSGWISYRTSGNAGIRFFVCRPIDGKPASIGNGTTIGLSAADRATVGRFHQVALAAGGCDEGAPGPRPHYKPDFYGAYVRDPDGHKICCVCLQPIAGAGE